MNYEEFVRFAVWLKRHGKITPFVWIEEGPDERVDIDGSITPDEIDRFNAEEGQ